MLSHYTIAIIIASISRYHIFIKPDTNAIRSENPTILFVFRDRTLINRSFSSENHIATLYHIIHKSFSNIFLNSIQIIHTKHTIPNILHIDTGNARSILRI